MVPFINHVMDNDTTIPKSEFPRILILTSSVFNQFTGGGVLLTNLFQGWPSEKIAIIHNDPSSPDQTICRNQMRLGKNELKLAFPFSFFYRMSHENNSQASETKKNGFSPNFTRRIFAFFKSSFCAIFGSEIPWKICLTDSLTEWINQFKPQLIYTFAGGPYMQLSLDVAKKWDIPIASHMMDDWPARIEAEGSLLPFYRKKAQADLKGLFSSSALRMTICDSMSRAYEKRYGFSFTSFQNAADIQVRAPYSKKDWSISGKFTVLYVGSILQNAQLQSLIDIAEAVSLLNRQGTPIEMKIHSPMTGVFRSKLEISPAISVRPPLDEENIFSTLVNSDLLLLPVNFDNKSIEYIRYSMPAKVPLYLISGTPILVYGPPDVAQVQYALETGWGQVVTQRNPDLLQSTLLRLYRDLSLRETVGKKDIQVAKDKHDLSRVRLDFHTHLIRATEKSLNLY